MMGVPFKMKLQILENDKVKLCRSENYNFNFDKTNGNFERWGKTQADDPEFAPAPEILDFEVTTICDHGCPFCYKGNTKNGHNTSFADFKTVIDKIPKTLTQVAFGADASATANPELFDMMRYARSIGVIPNITVADITRETAKTLSELCGAVAVSRYAQKMNCYRSIELLNQEGLEQVNMHILVSQETEAWIYETMQDYLDGNIPGLNAIVLLGLKKRGRGTGYNTLSQERYSDIINFALDNDIPIGADSCSGPKLINSVLDRPNFKEIYEMVDPCESTLFSMYVDEKCKFYPCSFMPKADGWEEGIDMLTVEDFGKVWNAKKTLTFRHNLCNNKDVNGCRECPVFEV
jgi:radical SAM protein with 4Fe4S-binding SPASM domain